MPLYNDNDFLPPAPVVSVTLRDPDSGNSVDGVPLLIDTGADVTLLPQAFVEKLGLSADAGDSYRLVGFDGKSSLSHPVSVHLILGRKTFRGRYLLIDQPIGVLGRDILNFLRLHFDGPNRTWEER